MGASVCSGCGQPLRAGLRVCTQCGLPVPTAPPVAVAAENTGPVLMPAPAVVPQAVPAVQAAPQAVYPPVVAPAPTYEPTPVAYEEQRPPDRRNDTRRVVLIGVLALVLTLIARIAITAATHEPEPDGEIVAQLPVGPEGGSARFDDGGKIKVPKGAVDEQQTITVRRTVIRERIRAISPFSGSIVIPAGAQTVYIFSPATIVFLRPVTIVLPAPLPPAQAIVFVSANGQLTFIQGREGAGTITVRVNSFNFSRGSRAFVG